MSEMVERVAKVIYSHYPVSMGEARMSARAAIAAMRDATDEMKLAGGRALFVASEMAPLASNAGESYEAMIDAALAEKK